MDPKLRLTQIEAEFKATQAELDPAKQRVRQIEARLSELQGAHREVKAMIPAEMEMEEVKSGEKVKK